MQQGVCEWCGLGRVVVVEDFCKRYGQRSVIFFVHLKLRHNRAKSIAGSPCGDRGLESCKNPAAIRRFSTHPGLIRRWSGKFNSQLKFAGWSADSSPLFLIRRRPVGHRPIIERRSGGHRPKCSGKNLQVIERRSGNRRPMTARCHQGYRTGDPPMPIKGPCLAAIGRFPRGHPWGAVGWSSNCNGWSGGDPAIFTLDPSQHINPGLSWRSS